MDFGMIFFCHGTNVGVGSPKAQRPPACPSAAIEKSSHTAIILS